MRVAGIREFRNKAPEMVGGDELVFITRHGKLSGILVPLKDPRELPVDLKRELLESLGAAIADHLSKHGVSEKKVLRDFESWRGKRRKGSR